MAWPRAFAALICAASLAVLAWCVVLLARWPDVGVLVTVVVIAFLLPALALGLVIALRRPHNRIAPLLCLVGAVPLLVVGLGDEYTAVVAAHPGALPVSALVVGLSQGSWMLLYLPPAFLMLVFPDGRLPGRNWRWVAAGLVVVPAAFIVLCALDPAPYPPPFTDVPHALGVVPAQIAPIGIALPVAFLGLLVASAAAMIVRYRRADGPVARAQVRWFALGATLLPLTLLLCWLSYLVFDTPDLVVVGLGLTAVAIPAATAIAVLRHDLYDVDRAFSATITYGLLSALLLAIFATMEVAGGVLFGRDSAEAAAVATAICALALSPLRSRLKDQVDRRFYPLRRSVRDAVAQLRTQVDAGVARPEDLPAVLRVALRDPGLRVGYVLPGRAGLVDEHCVPVVDVGHEVPVRLGDTHIGSLLPSATTATRELLRETASGCALLVEVIRSRLEIREALQEVAESRARLLQAGYRERRRLERDLHDGAQQRLVSLGMSIRIAQRHLSDEGAGARAEIDGLLDQAVAELGTAVAELRAIAQGLRPLDLDSGLGPAIRSLTTALPIPVRLDVLDEDVPDEVATTAYYVASEALANVVKHADAENIDVCVIRRDGHVVVRVSDDGRGGAVARPGSGLAGLVDRVAAAGGRFSVGHGVGTDTATGTMIEAVLPCGP
ncbi:histidine kinase [Pseudonocardia yunnanensis]|uniref:histidine kinase n=1 Tax=Pseudonocardia yunnanensis TaxID=58107 RepID=A0ABW4F957_9PSEU